MDIQAEKLYLIEQLSELDSVIGIAFLFVVLTNCF